MEKKVTKKPVQKRKPRCQSCTSLRKELSKLKSEKLALDSETGMLYDVVMSGAEFLGNLVKFMEKEGMA